MTTRGRVLDTATISTPTGPLALLVDGDVVVASGFVADAEQLYARVHPDLRGGLRRVAELGVVAKAVALYLDGDAAALDDIAIDQRGTDNQRRVWQALREIPAGTTVSYGSLASRVGVPSAVRAVANACACNLVAPIVPCHRVVRSDGSLGGYAYGLHVKQWLLDHERR